jgi:dynein heavy chain
MLRRYYALIENVPEVYRSMLAPQMDDLLDKIKPGLTTLSWMSLNIDAYLAGVFQHMARVEDIVSKANGALSPLLW